MMVPFENEETVKHMYVVNGSVRVPFWPQVSPYRVYCPLQWNWMMIVPSMWGMRTREGDL